MEKPILSPDFTMDDLRNLREYNSLRHIGMTTEELNADLNKGANEMQMKIDLLRKNKMSNAKTA